MAVLQASEYDARYFEGRTQDYTHNAGYGEYSRMQYNLRSTRHVPTLEESTGTVFGDLIKGMGIKLNNRFIGKKLLVVGCAYGFEVEQFRALGIDAYGIDVSAFAISQAKAELQPYLEVADARTKMSTYKRNEWDFIFSRWFLECMSDADLAGLITDMNTACKQDQVHIINTSMRTDYYNAKPILDWADLPFDVGTILIPNDNLDEYMTVIN